MRRFSPSIAAVIMLAFAACATEPTAAPAQLNAASLLQGSDPAPGSTVAQPVNAMTLRFAPPAHLHEVTVAGPDGMMPMMISAAGEQAHYSIPLPALGPGAYTVTWRATSGARKDSGSFAFTVK